MHTRALGQGLQVSAIGLGCMSTTGGYSSHPDRGEMIAMVRGAVDLENVSGRSPQLGPRGAC